MSEALPDFKLLQPANVKQAVTDLQNNPSARLYAGGTDLMVNMRRCLVEAQTLVDISTIPDLNRLEFNQASLFIGAAVTLRKVIDNPQIAKSYPAVHQACLSIAGPGHREVATVGGNLCLDTRCIYYNQSHWWRKANDFCLKYKGDVCHVAPTKKQCRAAYSGDLAPALMVHGARLEIAGPDGHRHINLHALYNEDGADHLELAPAEMIVGVYLPPARAVSDYKKVRIRGAIDFPLAGVAISCRKSAARGYDFTIAITGTNSCPVLMELPNQLTDNDEVDGFFAALAKQVQKQVSPLRTTTTAAHYRRLAISARTEKLARQLWQQLKTPPTDKGK